MSRAYLCVFVVGLCACAGELENKERFDFLLDGSVEDPEPGPTPSPDPDPSPDPTPDPAPDPSPDPTPDPDPTPAPPACFTAVMEDSCGGIGCHAAGSQLDLVSDGVADRLVDKTAAPGACNGKVYVASDGSESLLTDKISASPSCGSPMPLTGGPLTTEEISCIEDYVGTLQGGM